MSRCVILHVYYILLHLVKINYYYENNESKDLQRNIPFFSKINGVLKIIKKRLRVCFKFIDVLFRK